jgi:hypothetical protein
MASGGPPPAAAQHPEEAAHLAQGAPPRLLDHAQRSLGLLGVALQQVAADAGLDRDHAHGMGQDVMQVAGDAGALLERGPGRVGDAEAGHHQQRRPSQGQQGQDVGGQQGPAQPVERPGVAGAGRRGEEDHAEDPGQPGVDGQRTIGTRHGLTLPATAGGGVGHPDDPAPTPEVVGGRTRPPAAAEVLLAVHSPSCRRTPAGP